MQTASSGCSASGAAVGCTKTVLVQSNMTKSAVGAKLMKQRCKGTTPFSGNTLRTTSGP